MYICARVVRGEAPLAELRGYATELRTLTSGKANISMELSHYEVLYPLMN